jgi:Putative transposase
MRETLLLDRPHRQVVFTIPRMLRIFFKYKRWLLGELCLSAALHSLIRYLEAVAWSELMPGVIAAIQTFGDWINLHPHLHFLVTEGGVDEAGIFHKIPRIDDSRLAELFTRKVPGFLVHKKLLSPKWAGRLLSGRHAGFNVHSRVRARAKREAEQVGKCIIRPLLSLGRLSPDEREAQVGYRYGKVAKDLKRMDYPEFTARVTCPIPDKGQVTVRYYGLCANAHRRKI